MDSNRDEALIWWEKTVEYQFVIEILTKINEGAAFAPLDGNQESAGDLLLNANNKFFIIEFKKDNSEDAKRREKDKYTDFQDAMDTLKPGSNGHYVVFGELINNKLVLKYNNYWLFLSGDENKNPDKELNILDENFLKTSDLLEFYLLTYADMLMKNKSSGSSSSESLKTVVMICSDDKIKQVANLDDIVEIIRQIEQEGPVR
ncbi:hypothetical protein KAR29_04995 [Aminithiophilus ramosus]|uniref:Uncharacterized protein n=1 Tax=Aminithiophilus ramosus TaxID=3029084 RepID=A0A9Q7EY93_9BACT|nr:hypothetical protein [Aminithiophilus ramosus]QTX33250.1 hypothetical protein KAR29_04995 [Aminithiophilus ramosus]